MEQNVMLMVAVRGLDRADENTAFFESSDIMAYGREILPAEVREMPVLEKPLSSFEFRYRG